MPTVTVKVNSIGDDGFVQGGMPYPNAPGGVDVGLLFGSRSDGWFRLLNVTVPQGAAITRAVLRFAGSLSWRTVNLKICAEASDNVEAAPSYDYYRRARTSAAVAWSDVPAWSGWTESPDVAGVIQEIVNRPGWVSGNALCVFIEEDGSVQEAESRALRRIASYEGDPASALELVVTYGEAPPQTTAFVGYVSDRIGAWHILYLAGVPAMRDYESYPLRAGDSGVRFDVQLDPAEPYLDEIVLTSPAGAAEHVPRSGTAGSLATFTPTSALTAGVWTLTAKDYTTTFEVLPTVPPPTGSLEVHAWRA